jgi:hypothetical protein
MPRTKSLLNRISELEALVDRAAGLLEANSDRDARLEWARVIRQDKDAQNVTFSHSSRQREWDPLNLAVDGEQATATLHLSDSLAWHDGPGWYYVMDDYPDEGSCGAFVSMSAAAEHAKASGLVALPCRDDGGPCRCRPPHVTVGMTVAYRVPPTATITNAVNVMHKGDENDGYSLMQDRIRASVALIVKFGGIDGEHHKKWVIDQVTRLLTGDHYTALVAEARAGVDGPDVRVGDGNRTMRCVTKQHDTGDR